MFVSPASLMKALEAGKEFAHSNQNLTRAEFFSRLAAQLPIVGSRCDWTDAESVEIIATFDEAARRAWLLGRP